MFLVREIINTDDTMLDRLSDGTVRVVAFLMNSIFEVNSTCHPIDDVEDI